MLFRLSVVALTLASYFYMYFFYSLAWYLLITEFMTNAMKKTPSPARNETPMKK